MYVADEVNAPSLCMRADIIHTNIPSMRASIKRQGVYAGVTCQNRKWLHMSRPDFTCLLTRFLLLQELGEAYSLRDNKLL